MSFLVEAVAKDVLNSIYASYIDDKIKYSIFFSKAYGPEQYLIINTSNSFKIFLILKDGGNLKNADHQIVFYSWISKKIKSNPQGELCLKFLRC